MVWLEVIGWLGSALVVASLAQARVLRFRVLNLVGAVLATGYNAALSIWPFVAMNGVIAIIDVYWLIRLQRERHDEATYEVVEVEPTDAYLAHVLGVNLADIRTFQPGFAWEQGVPGRLAFLVLRGDEMVGVVVVRDAGDGVGQVELDYVTKRFRDFTPGEFVYRRSGVFAQAGFRRLVAPSDIADPQDYYARVGFRAEDGRWVRDVAAPEPTGAPGVAAL
ncbi:hypothetical protein [Pengzhenrongella frigida]|uniref:YgjV family protein n=1 Tax=Pengzhenrongella frigida TaxID=1259133 RepID=A0A4Q5N3U8_9MICO|nr:hypothetical protein [Cellulomonas sp. HLT2-17]RYV52918.1 hypothetical protein EUA98_00015 [Cellulomonas sp. HLT2-17]